MGDSSSLFNKSQNATTVISKNNQHDPDVGKSLKSILNSLREENYGKQRKAI